VSDHDRHVAYGKYNLLVWLHRVDGDWSEATEELARVQSANQTFAPRDHPDFDHWSSSGTWGGRLPIDPENFIQQAQADARLALAELLARDYSERDFDEPTWDDALSVVRRAVEISPDLGEVVWNVIAERPDLGDSAPDLRRAIIGGWERADLGSLASNAVLLVGTEVENEGSARSISQFLLAQIRKTVESDETPAIQRMRAVAVDLWAANCDTFTHAENSSFLSLNSWPGELASYWVTEIDRRWRHDRARDQWKGLNQGEESAILALLSGKSQTIDATCPAIASQAFFLFAADAKFSEAHVVPLFHDDATATLAWGAFLYHPRFDDLLLGAGLLDAMVLEWSRLGELETQLHSQFVGFVAAVLSFAGLTGADRQRLLDQSVLAADGAFAARFASETVDLLESKGVEGSEIWDLWLRTHIAARLDGLPRIPEPEELARWADAVPFLGDRVGEAIEMLEGRRIGLGAQYRAPQFSEGVLESRGAELVAHLAERVRNSEPEGWLIPHEVRELIEVIRRVMGDGGVQPIVEAAREQGFPTSEF
jgi:hypothetical protein